jgi:hypothetical protein
VAIIALFPERGRWMSDTLDVYNQIIATPVGAKMFNEVFNDENNWGISADIEPDLLFCTPESYKALAKIIPRSRVVYDFGAAYGFQSWLFRHHKRYIAIQPMDHGNNHKQEMLPFRTDNSIWFNGTMQEFFEQFSVEDNSFAICNYVPDKEAESLVRHNCPHLFVNYVTDEDCRAIFRDERSK